jgi:K+-transporting ATPase ATPase C chain
VDAIKALIATRTQGHQFGFFGEARVNVLLLNLALDSAFPRPRAAAADPAVGHATDPSLVRR